MYTVCIHLLSKTTYTGIVSILHPSLSSFIPSFFPSSSSFFLSSPPPLLLSSLLPPQVHCQFLQTLQEHLQTIASTPDSHHPLHTPTPTHLSHTTSWRKLSTAVSTTAASLTEEMRRTNNEVRGQGSKINTLQRHSFWGFLGLTLKYWFISPSPLLPSSAPPLPPPPPRFYSSGQLCRASSLHWSPLRPCTGRQL